MESFEESFDKVKKGFVSSLNKVRGKEEPEPVPEDEQSFFSDSVSSVSRQYSKLAIEYCHVFYSFSRLRKHLILLGSNEQLVSAFALV